jgi:hypothetical protein
LRIDGHEGHGTVGREEQAQSGKDEKLFHGRNPLSAHATLRVLAPRNVFEDTNVTFAQVDHAILRWPGLAERGAPMRRALRPPLPA